MKARKYVLVTGAAGFVGKHVVYELLQEMRYKANTILAMDIQPPETIAKFFDNSTRVFPISMDLCCLLKEGTERDAIEKFMCDVEVVLHVAGCVDTRETKLIRKRLESINYRVTEALGLLAEKCGSRFVFVSSAAAGLCRSPSRTFPSYYRLFLRNSLLTDMSFSSYGTSKRQAEEALLQCSSLQLAILRPHVVWGRGDPLSTDMLLQWPAFVPYILFGDANTSIVEIRVDILSKYILLADMALLRNSATVSQHIYHIGSSKTTLHDHQQHIAQFAHRIYHVAIFIRGILAFLLVVLCEWLDAWNMRLPLHHLISANNLAYCSHNAVDGSCMKNYKEECRALYEGAFGADGCYDKWLSQLHCDRDALLAPRSPSQFRASQTSVPVQLARPGTLGSIQMRNRVIKAATFECMAEVPSGVPTDELISFHRRVAAGGAAMTVVAYASVSPHGRSFASQISLRAQDKRIRSATHSQLRKLCSAVHDEGALAALQITHAGAFADPAVTCHAPLGPTAIFNPLTLKTSTPLSADDEREILEDYVASVVICRDVGFDAVELHLGHGYLLSQYLSYRTNPKPASERLRFPLAVVKAVCSEAHRVTHRPLAVLVKFNVSEANESDLPHADIRTFAAAFMATGADMLVPSGGHVMTNGLHMLRGGRPLQKMAMAQTNPIKQFIIGCLGWIFVASETYRDTFFREKALSIALGAGISLNKICLIGGVHDANSAERAVCDGFGAVQLGRALLADPDWCHKIGITSKKELRCSEIRICDNSNECIVGATMAQKPLRCSKYVNDW